MKCYTFTIPPDVPEGRLMPLVRRMLPELPDYAIRAAFDKRDVKLNGLRVDAKATALPGGEVKLYAPETEKRRLIHILYQDNDLIVIKKPVGVSCQPDAKGGRTVTELVAEVLRQSDPAAAQPLLCHRLDNQTDGLLLLAKNEAAQAAMEEAFRLHQIQKHYTCLVKGTPKPERATLRAYLIKDEAKAKVRVVSHPSPEAVPIVTEYAVIQGGEQARLDIALHTGRTHQIRAQMAAVGHPLVGDDKYGDRAFNKRYKAKRLMLCATSLSFALEGRWRYMNAQVFHLEPDF